MQDNEYILMNRIRQENLDPAFNQLNPRPVTPSCCKPCAHLGKSLRI